MNKTVTTLLLALMLSLPTVYASDWAINYNDWTFGSTTPTPTPIATITASPTPTTTSIIPEYNNMSIIILIIVASLVISVAYKRRQKL